VRCRRNPNKEGNHNLTDRPRPFLFPTDQEGPSEGRKRGSIWLSARSIANTRRGKTPGCTRVAGPSQKGREKTGWKRAPSEKTERRRLAPKAVEIAPSNSPRGKKGGKEKRNRVSHSWQCIPAGEQRKGGMVSCTNRLTSVSVPKREGRGFLNPDQKKKQPRCGKRRRLIILILASKKKPPAWSLDTRGKSKTVPAFPGRWKRKASGARRPSPQKGKERTKSKAIQQTLQRKEKKTAS